MDVKRRYALFDLLFDLACLMLVWANGIFFGWLLFH